MTPDLDDSAAHLATGEDHYDKAEELLDLADRSFVASDDASMLIAKAQVHATLALASATYG